MGKKKISIGVIIVILVGIIVYFNSRNSESSKGIDVNNDAIIDTKTEFDELDDNSIVDDKIEESIIIDEEVTTNYIEDKNQLLVAQKIVNSEVKYGYINVDGEFILAPKYDYATDYVESVAVVTKEDKYYLIDQAGKVLYKDAQWLGEINEGIINYMKEVEGDYLYGYISTKGELITEPIFLYPADFNKSGYANVKIKGNQDVKLNRLGEIVETYEIDERYENYTVADDFIIYEDLEKNKYGVDTLGGEVILDCIYGYITYLHDGMFAVVSPKLVSYDVYETVPVALFNSQKEQLTDYILYDIQPFDNEYTTVTDSTYTYFIDKSGNTVEHLPKVEGRGSSKLLGNIIKEIIDDEIFYVDVNGKLVYKVDKTIQLNDKLFAFEQKFKPNKYVTIRYPRIQGLGANSEVINEFIKSNFIMYREEMKEVDGILAQVDYNISLKKNLLLVEMTGYDYSVGALHGMPFLEFFYIDVTTGEVYELEDLFIEDSAYEDIMNEYIQSEINIRSKEESSNYFTDAFVGIGENRDFKLTSNGIQIYFYPYEIADYAEGFTKFYFSFDYLKECIDYNGNFANSFMN